MLFSCRGQLIKGGAQQGNSQVAWRESQVQCEEKSTGLRVGSHERLSDEGEQQLQVRLGSLVCVWQHCLSPQCPWSPHSISYLITMCHISPWCTILVYLPRRQCTSPFHSVLYHTAHHDSVQQKSDAWWLCLVKSCSLFVCIALLPFPHSLCFQWGYRSLCYVPVTPPQNVASHSG